jgi:hypothetical protein
MMIDLNRGAEANEGLVQVVGEGITVNCNKGEANTSLDAQLEAYRPEEGNLNIKKINEECKADPTYIAQYHKMIADPAQNNAGEIELIDSDIGCDTSEIRLEEQFPGLSARRMPQPRFNPALQRELDRQYAKNTWRYSVRMPTLFGIRISGSSLAEMYESIEQTRVSIPSDIAEHSARMRAIKSESSSALPARVQPDNPEVSARLRSIEDECYGRTNPLPSTRPQQKVSRLSQTMQALGREAAGTGYNN